MAWTGSATRTMVSDRMFRIAGLSLAADASGTIGFFGGNPAAEQTINMPWWTPYKNGDDDLITLRDAIKISFLIITDVTAPVPISVVKTGTDQGDWLATFHNDLAGGGTTSGQLEIYLEYH